MYILTNLTITLNSTYMKSYGHPQTCETFIRLGKAGVFFNLNFSELRKIEKKRLKWGWKGSKTRLLGLKKSCEVEKEPGPWKSMSCIFQSHLATTWAFSASAPRASSSTRRSWVKPGRWHSQPTGHGTCWFYCSNIISPLPETNSSPLKKGHPKRKLVFQPSIFRCYVLVLGRVVVELRR